MEISPIIWTVWTLNALVLGSLLGMVHDVHRIIRLLCGAPSMGNRFQALYERPLPVVHRPIRLHAPGRLRRGGLVALTIIQDILFFVIAGLGILLLQYEHNSGRFRWFAIVAVMAGFLLYYFTVGKLVMLMSEGIVFFLKAAFWVILGAVSLPFRVIFFFFVKKIKKIILKLKTVIEKKQKKMYNKNRKLELLKKADVGFLEQKGRRKNERTR